MNCSFCAWADAATPSNAKPNSADLTDFMVSLLKIALDSEANLDSIGESEVRVNGSPTRVANIVGKATIPSAYCIAASMWEWPQAELFLGNLP
jgi:hypothetical protein